MNNANTGDYVPETRIGLVRSYPYSDILGSLNQSEITKAYVLAEQDVMVTAVLGNVGTSKLLIADKALRSGLVTPKDVELLYGAEGLGDVAGKVWRWIKELLEKIKNWFTHGGMKYRGALERFAKARDLVTTKGAEIYAVLEQKGVVPAQYKFVPTKEYIDCDATAKAVSSFIDDLVRGFKSWFRAPTNLRMRECVIKKKPTGPVVLYKEVVAMVNFLDALDDIAGRAKDRLDGVFAVEYANASKAARRVEMGGEPGAIQKYREQIVGGNENLRASMRGLSYLETVLAHICEAVLEFVSMGERSINGTQS